MRSVMFMREVPAVFGGLTSRNRPNSPVCCTDELNMTTKTRSKKTTTKTRKSAKKARHFGPENRASERTRLVAAATLFTELTPHPDEGHKVWVTNISLGGIAFKTRRMYEPGDIFHIRLDAGPIDMSAPIKIVWIRPQADGIYECGTEFLPD